MSAFCCFVFFGGVGEKQWKKNRTHPRYQYAPFLFTHFYPAIVQGRGKSVQKETWRSRALEQKTLSRFYSCPKFEMAKKEQGPHSLGLGRGNWAPFGRTGQGGVSTPPFTPLLPERKKKFLLGRAVHPPLTSSLGGSDPPLTKTFFALPGNSGRRGSSPTGDTLATFPARHSGFCRFTRPDLLFMYCP